MPRPFAYTNRRGRVYYLRAVPSMHGKTRYVFSRKAGADALARVPPGQEVSESVNGVVSLARIGSFRIREADLQTVRAVIAGQGRLRGLRVGRQKDAVVVYEPLGLTADEFARAVGLEPAGFTTGRDARQYTPVLRFRLVDPETHEFVVDRMCHRSFVDDWLCLNDVGTLARLARHYVPHAGRESFYELI